jgi:hypothetical protein
VLPAATTVVDPAASPAISQRLPKVAGALADCPLEPEPSARRAMTASVSRPLEQRNGIGRFELQNEFVTKRLAKRRAHVLRRVSKDRRDAESIGDTVESECRDEADYALGVCAR